MEKIHLRPENLDKDFKEIAALISSQEDQRTTEAEARKDYETHIDKVIRLRIAEDEQGRLLGFTWAYRQELRLDRSAFTLVVKPEERRQGVGRALYADLLAAAEAAGIKVLRVRVLDDDPASRQFIERRGFSEQRHDFKMELDLDKFDEGPYEAMLERLKKEGFCFTSMEALGNTEAAQRKLYALNDSTDRSTPGTDGTPTWASFEDFQKKVCQANWYHPSGQLIAIDTSSGQWAALSAITKIGDHAHILHTGVYLPYRGRKLGQAIKVLALRYARDVLKVHSVHTDHNTKNLPIIAIDEKFGYRRTRGTVLMEKTMG